MTHIPDQAPREDAPRTDVRAAAPPARAPAGDWADTRRGAWTLAAFAWCGYFAFAAFLTFHDIPDADASVPLAGVRAATAASTTPLDRSAAIVPGDAVARPALQPDQAAQNDARSLRAPTQGVQIERAGPDMPEATAAAGLQFIVKFEGELGEEWRDRYVADPAAAREAFAALGRRNSAFAGLRLLRMNNSGEATLEFDGPVPPVEAVARELSADIVRRLSAAEGVEWAEPNLVGLRETEQ